MFSADARGDAIHAAGELDLATAAELEQLAVAALERCSGPVLSVDLQECTFIDATAVAVLVDLRAAARESGKDLRLRSTPPRVVRVLNLLGLDAALDGTDGRPSEVAAQLRARAARARMQRREVEGELRSRMSQTEAAVARMERELTEARHKIEHLEVALQTARRIGQATGIVMERLKITESEAFGVLRIASEHSHRKLRDIADEVVMTGEVPTAA